MKANQIIQQIKEGKINISDFDIIYVESFYYADEFGYQRITKVNLDYLIEYAVIEELYEDEKLRNYLRNAYIGFGSNQEIDIATVIEGADFYLIPKNLKNNNIQNFISNILYSIPVLDELDIIASYIFEYEKNRNILKDIIEQRLKLLNHYLTKNQRDINLTILLEEIVILIKYYNIDSDTLNSINFYVRNKEFYESDKFVINLDEGRYILGEYNTNGIEFYLYIILEYLADNYDISVLKEIEIDEEVTLEEAILNSFIYIPVNCSKDEQDEICCLEKEHYICIESFNIIDSIKVGDYELFTEKGIVELMKNCLKNLFEELKRQKEKRKYAEEEEKKRLEKIHKKIEEEERKKREERKRKEKECEEKCHSKYNGKICSDSCKEKCEKECGDDEECFKRCEDKCVIKCIEYITGYYDECFYKCIDDNDYNFPISKDFIINKIKEDEEKERKERERKIKEWDETSKFLREFYGFNI